MSHLNSWEDDPSAQDENLSRQAQQQLNMNQGQQGGFRANAAAASFQPTAQAFQPGQFGGFAQQYQQQYYQQQGYYPQYGGQQGFDQYGGYQQSGYGQNYGSFSFTYLSVNGLLPANSISQVVNTASTDSSSSSRKRRTSPSSRGHRPKPSPKRNPSRPPVRPLPRPRPSPLCTRRAAPRF